MRVIIYAQDLSGRNDDGYYTKPNLSSALDMFFEHEGADTFFDEDGEMPLMREDAEEIFLQERRISFFNSNGEKVVISLDPSV